MRQALVTLVLVAGFALPAAADECSQVGFDWTYGADSPMQVGTGVESVRVDTVGTFLWVQVGNELSSVEIPFGAVSATACAEGVTFDLPETAPAIEPTHTVADVSAEEWERFIEPATFGIH